MEWTSLVSDQIRRLTSSALSVKAEGAGFLVMRSRDVADTVVVLTLGVLAALAGRVVGAGPVQVTVAPATLVTVKVIATLRIVRTAQGTVDGAGPVTDRTHGELEPHVEGESPLSVTEGVGAYLCLTSSTLEQTSLP